MHALLLYDVGAPTNPIFLASVLSVTNIEAFNNNKKSYLFRLFLFHVLLLLLVLKVNLSSGSGNKYRLTESKEIYTECSELYIIDNCQVILKENV